jgi:excisionase family DNA binding protein
VVVTQRLAIPRSEFAHENLATPGRRSSRRERGPFVIALSFQREMKQNSHQNRTTRRQTIPIAAANDAANGNLTGDIAAVPVADAARLLAVDARTIRRMCAAGKLRSFITPGGHRRVVLAEIEAIRDGNAESKRVSMNFPNPTLQQKKERIEELHLTIQEKKANLALQEIENDERRRAEEQRAAREAQEQEARRARLAAQAERSRRNREREQARTEALAAQARQEWEAEWLRVMLCRLPHDLPPELRLEIANTIRHELPQLYEMSGHAEDIVDGALQVAVERILRPWRRTKEAERAADEAVNQLPLFARAAWGQTSEWELRAKQEALAAIAALPGSATFPQMSACARSAGKRIADEYERQEVQARAERKAKQGRARLEAEAEMHLSRVLPYLVELEADPEGWDFEGQLYEYASQIKQDIKRDLMEELTLDFTTGRKQVEQLADKWLAHESHS